MQIARILSVMLVSIVVFTSGCETNKTADENYRDAVDAYEKGEAKAAVIHLKNAAEKEPNFAPARYMLAVIYNEFDDFNSAEKEARKALELGFDKGQASIELGRALLGQLQGAKLLEEIAATGTQTEVLATVTALRGNAHLVLREFEAAKKDFDQALELSPMHPDGLIGLARLAVVNRDATTAMKYLDQAISKSPHNIKALLFKGDLLRAAGEIEQAATVYNEVLKVRKDHVRALLSLASIAIGASKLEEAREQIARARKLQPDNLKALHMTALLDFREGKLEQARDNVQKVLKSSPNHLPSVALLGAVSFALGSYELALQNLSTALEKQPQDSYIRKLLVSTQLKQGKTDDALKTIKPLLANQTDAFTLSLAGEVYLRLGEPVKAADYFEKAAAAEPDNVTARAKLGLSRMASGDAEAGLEDLDQASRLNNELTQVDGVLVVTYMQLRQYDKALAAVDAFEKKQPSSPITHNLRGGIYLGKRDFVNARKSFEKALSIDQSFFPAAKNLAQLDIQDRKPELARKRYKAILDGNEKSTAAMLALADLAADENKDDETLEWIEKAIKTDPKALEPKMRLVNYYLVKNENQKALALARETQSMSGDSPQAWELLGRAQIANNEKENAISSFLKVIQFAPESPRGHFELGATLMAANRWKDAKGAFQKALFISPDHFEARRALINLELRQQRNSEAMKLATEYSRRYPKSAAGPTFEGDVFLAQRQYAQAIKSYERAFNLVKSSPVAIKLHQAMSLAGNQSEADSRILAWLNEQPSDVGARVYLAESYMARKNHKAAIAQYEIVLKQTPDDPVVINNLAFAYFDVKDSRALATAERGYKLRPNNPVIQDTLGWILLGQGQASRAKDLLKNAVAGAPDEAEIRYHYAVVLAKSGDMTSAKQQLDLILKDRNNRFPSRSEAEALRRSM